MAESKTKKSAAKAAEPEEKPVEPMAPDAAPEAEEAGPEEAAADLVAARVVEKFRDAKTGSILDVGLVVVLTRERFDEIAAKGRYVEEAMAV